MLFGYFLHDAKSDNPFSLQRTSRFCKPRISAPEQQLRTNKIKSFCRSVSLKHGRLAHVRSQFSLFRRSPTHKNLPPATFCTSERVFAVLFARRKKYQSVSLTGKIRGFANLESAHPNQKFALTKLKPSQKENRGSANLDSARRNGGFPLTKLNPFKASFEVLKTSNQHTKLQIRTNKLKSCQKLLHTFC